MTKESSEAAIIGEIEKPHFFHRAQILLTSICTGFGAALVISGGSMGGWLGLIIEGTAGAIAGYLASLIFTSITTFATILAANILNREWVRYAYYLPTIIFIPLVLFFGSRTVERKIKENRMAPVAMHFESCVARRWKPEYGIQDEFTSPERIRQAIEKECTTEAENRSWLD